MTKIPRLPYRFKYHVVFSFASENGEYVEKVTAALPKKLHFDYRTPEAQAETWGRRLPEELQRIYKNAALFCVVFLSKEYVHKRWTQDELKIITEVEKEKPGYILPVTLDETPLAEIAEIKDLVWISGTTPPEQLARLIVAKICEPRHRPWWFYSKELRVAAAAALLAVILSLPSRTSFQSANATEDGITAHLVNMRARSATVVGQRLKFGALPLEDVDLRLAKGQPATIASVVRSLGGRDLKLVALEILTKCDEEGIRPNQHKVEPLLAQQPVTLELDIRESDDAPEHPTTRIQTFPAVQLKPLVRKLVAGRDTPCE